MQRKYFSPPLKRRTDELDFCLLGFLDNAWKGADTAIAAFQRVPMELRSKMRLHLFSYALPPVLHDKNIVAYPWKPLEEIPDLLRQMDVMIAPSRDEDVMRETFCLSAVQGMLAGLPLIVNNLPVLVEKLGSGRRTELQHGGRVWRRPW